SLVHIRLMWTRDYPNPTPCDILKQALSKSIGEGFTKPFGEADEGVELARSISGNWFSTRFVWELLCVRDHNSTHSYLHYSDTSECLHHPSRKPDLVFDAGALNDQQFEQAGKECRFEAAKAVAPRKYGDITGDTYRKIFILCLEAKGIKFLGSEDQINRRGR
ncbi:hypothetical protein, partial [Microvirga arabica]